MISFLTQFAETQPFPVAQGIERACARRAILAARTIERSAGRWLIANARSLQAKHGTAHAAVSLRKRGVPVQLAALILALPKAQLEGVQS